MGFSMEKVTLWGHLIAAFQYLKEVYKENGNRLFSRVCCDRINGNGFKPKESRFRLDKRKTFLAVRVVRHRSRLPTAK